MQKISFEKEIHKYTANSINTWKHRGFAILPHALLADERLPRSALMVFWVLTMHLFRGKKYVFPSLPTIAKEAHMCRRTAFTAVKKLRELGYLEIGKTKGKPNKYFLKSDI